MEFANRHVVQGQLAQQARGGVIVEIGGGYGNGLSELAHSGLPIYVIDPYEEEFTDELGASYGEKAEEVFLKALEEVGATHIRKKAQDVAEWDEPIALLWIDVSVKYDVLRDIWNVWKDRVAVGGYVGVTGLEYRKELGTRRLCGDIQGGGLVPILREQSLVACFVKPPLRDRAVFYVTSDADDGRYVWEANNSAESVKRHLGLPTHMFLSGKDLPAPNMDHIHKLPACKDSFWYMDSVRFMNHAVRELIQYEELLYLDTDTFICRPCLDIFNVLREFDMTLGHSPQRDAIETAIGTPSSFSTHQVGVNAFRNTDKVRAFLARWMERYEAGREIYDNNDQASLRDSLFRDHSIRFSTLAPEYCLRFDFGAWVVGWVRILHGRVGGISTTPLQPVCDEINQRCSMRVWNHGLINPDV